MAETYRPQGQVRGITMTLSSDNWELIRCVIIGIVLGITFTIVILFLTGTFEIFVDGLTDMVTLFELVLNTSIKY